MKRLRLWILGTAVGCFAAGMMVGTAIPRPAAAGSGPYATEAELAAETEYVASFSRDFGLTGLQQTQLRAVLGIRRAEELEVMKAGWEQLPVAFKSQVIAVRSREKERIRGLLDERQRRLYDERAGR